MELPRIIAIIPFTRYSLPTGLRHIKTGRVGVRNCSHSDKVTFIVAFPEGIGVSSFI